MDKQNNNGLLYAIVFILVALGAVYFIQSANGPSTMSDSGPIVIGAIAPLDGDAAAYGIPFQQATNLAVSEINAAGGIDGRQIELKWQDGGCDGVPATTAAQALVNVEGAKLILGGVCSSETLAAAQITQPARALLLSSFSTSPDITEAGDLVYRMYPSDAFAGKILASYAQNELNTTRAAVISENTDFAQGLRRVFVTSFIEAGNNVVFDEAFNTGDTDFRTLVTKLKASTPDVVYIATQTLTPSELILKQLKELGVRAVVLGSDPLLDREAIAASPTLYEGVILPEVPLDESRTQTSGFISAYTAAYGTSPEYPGYLAASYDAVKLLAQAIDEVGTDAEKIAGYFNDTVNNWEGAVGVFNFDENGDAVLSLNLRKIVAGEVTDLGPYTIE